jgi:flagellar biosynthetic protein FliQ
MTPDFAINLCRKAVETILIISAPMLISGLIIGLIISIFQAATQINEQTLALIPKIVIVFITLLIFGPWIIRIMTTFTIGVISSISTM